MARSFSPAPAVCLAFLFSFQRQHADQHTRPPKTPPWFYGQWNSSLSPPTLNFSPWFYHQWDHSSRPPTLHFHTAVQSWELHLRVAHVRGYSGCLPSISHRCSLFLLPIPFSSLHLSLHVLSQARNCRHLAASLHGLATCSPGTFPVVWRVSLPSHKPSLVSAKPQLAQHPMLSNVAPNSFPDYFQIQNHMQKPL